MLTGCQKLDSLLTMSYMHVFIKKIKFNMSFSGLIYQNMYALEAQICIYCADICIRQEILFWRPSWMSVLILKPRNNIIISAKVVRKHSIFIHFKGHFVQ